MEVGGADFINWALFSFELGRVPGLILADVLSLVFSDIGGLILIADLGNVYWLQRGPLNPSVALIGVRVICVTSSFWSSSVSGLSPTSIAAPVRWSHRLGPATRR